MNMEVPKVSLPMVYCFLISAIFFQFVIAGSPDDLKENFYSLDHTNKNTYCPTAETTIRDAIKTKALALDGNYSRTASLIRWHFHDCFVRGCDASVLLTKNISTKPENDPIFRMRGYELIEAAKTAVEKICPGVVSCADILAFAARDAFYYLRGQLPTDLYPVPAGRRDGNVSILQEAEAYLPRPNFNFIQLNNSFAAKNFSTEEMVALSGAHSVGQAHCLSFEEGRLYPDYNPNQIDPSYAQTLQQQCPEGVDAVVPQDYVTASRDILDAQYYPNVLYNKVLFFSDWALRTDPDAQKALNKYTIDILGIKFANDLAWRPDFIAAMQKLGKLQVLTGTEGQIRKYCDANN